MKENTLVKWPQTMTYWLRLEQQSALMCTNTWTLNSGEFVSMLRFSLHSFGETENFYNPR